MRRQPLRLRALLDYTSLGGMRGGNNCNTLGCGVVWEITP
jgi:hypothetical protein